ncbi:hypothetical protein OG394_22860 [Kribbella sp. NBC_01245]|uniref:hypothetical protein n=1 Tax=Kribbella sp. NBC_01245 TaxID=2903578 RepID=UPI002E2E88F1|nr:hypothetical protein [Kribbella sp. NBC_01245]
MSRPPRSKRLRVGYHHVDTAAAYLNEREVGDGLRRSGVARADGKVRAIGINIPEA